MVLVRMYTAVNTVIVTQVVLTTTAAHVILASVIAVGRLKEDDVTEFNQVTST